ncbi:16S rRNA (cytosine(1402)-N(4))-methyltransferase RsmH [Patescibacteria group bacterium]
MREETYHQPVMLELALEYLEPQVNKKYIDCTLGDGGHTLGLLKEGAFVLGIDTSDYSLERAVKRIDALGYKDNFSGCTGNFKNITEIAPDNGFEQVSGVIFDLGYSSSQLQESAQGLSFLEEQPLDMRLDRNLTVTAADLINSLPEKQLEMIIREYGGEKMARKFAKEIVNFRNLKKFRTTKDLADLLQSVAPSRYERGRIHPATRTFQALRISVNDELENLKNALPRAAQLLLPGGRMIIISFHSLEDSIAKDFGSNVQPNCKPLTKKPLRPSSEELTKNPKARSAKMRVYERI